MHWHPVLASWKMQTRKQISNIVDKSGAIAFTFLEMCPRQTCWFPIGHSKPDGVCRVPFLRTQLRLDWRYNGPRKISLCIPKFWRVLGEHSHSCREQWVRDSKAPLLSKRHANVLGMRKNMERLPGSWALRAKSVKIYYCHNFHNPILKPLTRVKF